MNVKNPRNPKYSNEWTISLLRKKSPAFLSESMNLLINKNMIGRTPNKNHTKLKYRFLNNIESNVNITNGLNNSLVSIVIHHQTLNCIHQAVAAREKKLKRQI